MSDSIYKKKQIEMKRLEGERAQKAFADYAKQHSNHAPVSRRDFLSAGVIPFMATLTAPTLASMISANKAHAQEAGTCPSSNANDPNKLSGFVTLNLAGGAMLAGNYVHMDAGGQTLPSYNKLGLGNSSLPITREFNNAPFAGNGISKLITGIRNTAGEALANTAFVAIPCRAQDDSGNNRFDMSGMVATAGLIGQALPNLGTRDSDTGVRQMFSKIKPPNPLRVRSFNDIEGALGGSGTGALANLSTNQKTSFFNLLKNLNESQTARILASSGGEMLSNLVKCASEKNHELASQAPPPADVRQDAGLASIWGVNGNTGAGAQDVVFGSMVLAGLTGAAGTVGLERGGYDYHNNTRTRGDGSDMEAGELIGKILASAAALNEKVFLWVTSDGACSAPVSESRSAPWRSDRGSAGMAMIFAYDPAGRPDTNGFQIGQFNDAQAADDSFITGSSPELAASAAFANYLKFNNKMDLLESVIPGTFSTADLNKIIKFG